MFAAICRWLFGDAKIRLWSEELINHTVGRFTFVVIRPIYFRSRGFWRAPEFCPHTTLVSVFFNLGWEQAVFLSMQAEPEWPGSGEYLCYPPQSLRRLAEKNINELDTRGVPWRLEASIESEADLKRVNRFFGKIKKGLAANPFLFGGKLRESEQRAISAFMSNLESGIWRAATEV